MYASPCLSLSLQRPTLTHVRSSPTILNRQLNSIVAIQQRSLVLTCAKRASKVVSEVTEQAPVAVGAEETPIVAVVKEKKPRAKKVVEPKVAKTAVPPAAGALPFFLSSRSTGSEASLEAAKPIKRLRRKVVGKAAAEGDDESKAMLEKSTLLNEKG